MKKIRKLDKPQFHFAAHHWTHVAFQLVAARRQLFSDVLETQTPPLMPFYVTQLARPFDARLTLGHLSARRWLKLLLRGLCAIGNFFDLRSILNLQTLPRIISNVQRFILGFLNTRVLSFSLIRGPSRILSLLHIYLELSTTMQKIVVKFFRLDK